MRSFFITLEGLEGAGKTTQAQLLTDKLRGEGCNVIATREPGGTRIGEQIRRITHDPANIDLTDEAEAYLMATARAQHVREIIMPALGRGKVVVCDRFIDSSLAYQGCGRRLGIEAVWELNRLALSTKLGSRLSLKNLKGSAFNPYLILPDLTILLKLDCEEGIKRRNSSYKIDRLDLQQKEFYRRVEKGYNRLAAEYKERIVEVDGRGAIESVFEKVWRVVGAKLDS